MYKLYRGSLAPAILAIAILAPSIAFPLIAHGGSTCKYYFVIYGQDWCPHCQKMEKFVKETYGEQCLEFRDLDVPKWNGNFTMIIKRLNNVYNVPIQPAFPLTGIWEDGKLRAIVLGEVTKPDSIDYIVQRADEEGKNWVVVFLGSKAYAIKPGEQIIEAFKPLKNNTSTSQAGRGVNKTLLYAGIALLAVGAVGVVLLARR